MSTLTIPAVFSQKIEEFLKMFEQSSDLGGKGLIQETLFHASSSFAPTLCTDAKVLMPRIFFSKEKCLLDRRYIKRWRQRSQETHTPMPDLTIPDVCTEDTHHMGLAAWGVVLLTPHINLPAGQVQSRRIMGVLWSDFSGKVGRIVSKPFDKRVIMAAVRMVWVNIQWPEPISVSGKRGAWSGNTMRSLQKQCWSLAERRKCELSIKGRWLGRVGAGLMPRVKIKFRVVCTLKRSVVLVSAHVLHFFCMCRLVFKYHFVLEVQGFFFKL